MVVNNLYKKFKHLRSAEGGYAMVVVLGIVILTIGILSSMTLITLSDSQSSIKNRQVLEARLAGESSLDTIYSSLNASKLTDILAASAQQPFLDALNTDSDTSAGGVRTRVYKWGNPKYWSISSLGVIAPCTTNLKETCFKARLITKTRDNKSDFGVSDISGTYNEAISTDEYTLDIVVRKNCATAFTACTYSRMQQTITKRKYIEYVSISETELVADRVKQAADPNWATNPAFNNALSQKNSYSNSDAVSSGSIHTNDSSVNVCNSFNILKWLTTGNNGGPAPTNNLTTLGISGCNAEPAGVKKASRNDLVLPNRNGDPTYANLKAFADADESSSRTYSFNTGSPVVIEFIGTQMRYGASVYPLPPNGVIFLEQGGSVYGTVDGKITVASSPPYDIAISGSLRYADETPYVPGVNPGTNDMIGINSGRDIIISCQTANPTARCSDIRIDGYLKTNVDPAYQSSIYNPNWATAVAGATPPKVTLFGAMESYNRGTLGSTISYPPSDAGDVSTGFAKDYSFDIRLREEQPPFMLRDGSVPFIRSGVKDVPCDDGTGNVCD